MLVINSSVCILNLRHFPKTSPTNVSAHLYLRSLSFWPMQLARGTNLELIESPLCVCVCEALQLSAILYAGARNLIVVFHSTTNCSPAGSRRHSKSRVGASRIGIRTRSISVGTVSGKDQLAPKCNESTSFSFAVRPGEQCGR